MAAGLFYELKMRHCNVELATEFAKDLTWEGRHNTLKNQVYVLGKQHHRIMRLVGKVEAVITDSPILFSKLYAGSELPASFHQCIDDLHKSFNSINYFVTRQKAYNPLGRNQTEEEAIAIDEAVLKMLNEAGIPFSKVPGSAEGLRIITDNVLSQIWP